MSRGTALRVCVPGVSLAEEADTLIKSYLQPLLSVASDSLSPYHTHTHLPVYVQTEWLKGVFFQPVVLCL